MLLFKLFYHVWIKILNQLRSISLKKKSEWASFYDKWTKPTICSFGDLDRLSRKLKQLKFLYPTQMMRSFPFKNDNGKNHLWENRTISKSKNKVWSERGAKRRFIHFSQIKMQSLRGRFEMPFLPIETFNFRFHFSWTSFLWYYCWNFNIYVLPLQKLLALWNLSSFFIVNCNDEYLCLCQGEILTVLLSRPLMGCTLFYIIFCNPVKKYCNHKIPVCF